MSAITSPATNTTGTSAWADSVADQINQMHAFMPLINANVTSTGAGTATWVTMGNITVPTWATRARVSLAINGIIGSVGTAAADLAVKIGTSTGFAWRVTAPGVTTRFSDTINDLLTSVPTGSQSVTVQATFQTGTLNAPAAANGFGLNIDWMQ